jgi:hypothetical protein
MNLRLSSSIHGLAVRLQCSVDQLQAPIRQIMDPFLVTGWPEGFVPTEGTVKPFDAAEVNRRLSSTAIPLSNTAGKLEVYAERERFWLVDDRWGMSEINLLKNQWRSWILPSPSIDPIAVAEMAVMWPMAQLLRCKGLCLLPAVSVVRDHWGLLLISPFGIQAELKALIRAGFKVIGQQWTALREEEGRIAMLHVPGRIERGGNRRIRSITSLTAGPSEWTDLAAEIPGITQFHAFCDVVVLVESGRRPDSWVRPVSGGAAQATLRRHWPIDELHPLRRQSRIMSQVGSRCRLFEARLSRNPQDLLSHLDSMHYGENIEAARRLLSGGPIPFMTVTGGTGGQIPTGREANPPENLTPWSLAG